MYKVLSIDCAQLPYHTKYINRFYQNITNILLHLSNACNKVSHFVSFHNLRLSKIEIKY